MNRSFAFIRESLHRRFYLILFIFGRQRILVVKNMYSGVGRLGSNFHFLHLRVVWSWKRCLTTLSLSCIICKMAICYPTGVALIIRRNTHTKQLAYGKPSTTMSHDWSYCFVHLVPRRVRLKTGPQYMLVSLSSWWKHMASRGSSHISFTEGWEREKIEIFCER